MTRAIRWTRSTPSAARHMALPVLHRGDYRPGEAGLEPMARVQAEWAATLPSPPHHSLAESELENVRAALRQVLAGRRGRAGARRWPGTAASLPPERPGTGTVIISAWAGTATNVTAEEVAIESLYPADHGRGRATNGLELL
jgi:hypothetical protein